ncbi:ATP-grasp domain-containing protein [Mumia zhuanghuii]|uniref:ATP-grasp domain-containing protein n=1 Tax=Mumia zhuanghuii TaxID=2585211 RepID=A0A5C4MH92_9ACTN|nr:ATP-grasp domain-containing protein [Mumia zhuanghuii]TNC42457.1 ATP-grasp domain-containing protein [Mumia zhuanghuii]TNC43696.1 ATP-grasp domain-containing protein [Mumia zhuanghuii]
MPTVLVTGAGGPAGASLGHQLAGRGFDGREVTTVGVDLTALEGTAFTRTAAVASAADPAYAPSMRAVIDEFRPDLVIPTVQDELAQVAVLADLLTSRGDAGATVVVAGARPSALAADKLLTMWALAEAGVPVPAHTVATDFTDTAEALAWAGGAVVVKPRVSRGGRGVTVVEKPEDLDWPSDDASWVVQGFVDGPEYAPQVYRSPETGRTTVVVLEKTALKEGRVGNAASAVRAKDGAVPDVAEVAAATVEALDLVGPVDMDMRRDTAGMPYVLEVNGRFGALSAHAPELLDHVLRDWLRPGP